MSYSKPIRITFSWIDEDIGNANIVDSIVGPSGMVGMVKEAVINNVTEAVTVTSGVIQVGASDGTAEYLSWTVPAVSTTDAAKASDVTGSITNTVMPADTQIEVTFVDSGATGICNVHIVTEWF